MFKRPLFLFLLLPLLLTACGGKDQPEESFAMFRQVDSTLQEQGWDQESVTKVVDLVLQDGTGSEIIYHYCETSYAGEVPSDLTLPVLQAIQSVVDLDTVQQTQPCKVCALDALRYRAEDRSFLCWSTDPSHTMVIEYDPSAVSDTEILKMAESVPANTP